MLTPGKDTFYRFLQAFILVATDNQVRYCLLCHPGELDHVEEDRPVTPLLWTDEEPQRLYIMVAVEEACHQYSPRLLTVTAVDVEDVGILTEVVHWL